MNFISKHRYAQQTQTKPKSVRSEALSSTSLAFVNTHYENSGRARLIRWRMAKGGLCARATRSAVMIVGIHFIEIE